MRAHLGDRDRGTTNDRRRQEAFRRELDEHWLPSTPEERRLDRRSRLVHLWTRWFDGPVGLRGAGIAALVAGLGSAVLTAYPPADPRFDSQVPVWIGTGLTLAVLWFAVECVLASSSVPRYRFAGASAAVAAFASSSAAVGQVTAPADAVMVAAFVVLTVGASLMAAGSAAVRVVWLRRGLVLAAISSWGVAVADGVWVVTFGRSGDTASALGCALAAAGTVVMANGLAVARPGIDKGTDRRTWDLRRRLRLRLRTRT